METVAAKTILQRSKAPSAWFGTEYTMNLYRGCCHGCIYCDSRSDCYHVEQFDTVRAKRNALPILRDELARKVVTGVVATGAMTDPYNPFEKAENLTRHALELLDAYSFGTAIATKSDLILRDADVLSGIKSHSPVLCKITITAADDETAAKLEPRAPSTSRRFAAVEGLSAQGIFTGLLLMPALPWITDTKENITAIVERAAASGARFIYPSFGLTMRAGQREHFLRELDKAYPEQNLSQKYQSRFGMRYHCASPRAKALWEMFTTQCDTHGILYNMQDIIRASRQGYGSIQLSFFS